jgi:hypothetical protein
VNSQPKGERVDEILARKSQVGQQTFSRAKKIIESGTPIQIEQLRSGKLSINKVYEEITHKHDVLDQKELESRMEELGRAPRANEQIMAIYDRLDRPMAYETSKGITCLGCGLLCESSKAFTEHLVRSTPRGHCSDEHFKKFYARMKDVLPLKWKTVFDEKINRDVCITEDDQKED